MMTWGNFGKTRWEDDTMGGDEARRRWLLLMMMRIESPFIGDSSNIYQYWKLDNFENLEDCENIDRFNNSERSKNFQYR